MTGFQWENERADIQLAHDKAESQARENKYKIQSQSMDLPIPEYGGSDATPITEIVKEMIEKESMRSLWYKYQVFWNIEDIHDAVVDVCISLGVDEDEYSPYLNVSFDQIEICLQ